jgi:hypothetical protein
VTDLYICLQLRDRLPGDDMDTFLVIPHSISEHCDHKTRICRDCFHSWETIRVIYLDRKHSGRSLQAHILPARLDDLDRLDPSAIPEAAAIQPPPNPGRRDQDAGATATTLDLTRTVSTLDQVSTWMRHLLAAGFPVDPETRGEDIIDLKTQTRTLTPAGAAEYDRIWAECWAVSSRLLLDLNSQAITIITAHEQQPTNPDAAGAFNDAGVSYPHGSDGPHEAASHLYPDSADAAPHEAARADEPRMAIHVDQTMLTPNGYVPAIVFEKEPGYYPLTGNGEMAQPWHWGHDLAVAKRLARGANAHLGLSPREAQDIVASSIAASLAPSAFQKPSDGRWDSILRALPPQPDVPTSPPSQTTSEPEFNGD